MIHTAKGFNIVSEEVDGFLEFFCIFYDPADGDSISGSFCLFIELSVINSNLVLYLQFTWWTVSYLFGPRDASPKGPSFEWHIDILTHNIQVEKGGNKTKQKSPMSLFQVKIKLSYAAIEKLGLSHIIFTPLFRFFNKK